MLDVISENLLYGGEKLDLDEFIKDHGAKSFVRLDEVYTLLNPDTYGPSYDWLPAFFRFFGQRVSTLYDYPSVHDDILRPREVVSMDDLIALLCKMSFLGYNVCPLDLISVRGAPNRINHPLLTLDQCLIVTYQQQKSTRISYYVSDVPYDTDDFFMTETGHRVVIARRKTGGGYIASCPPSGFKTEFMCALQPDSGDEFVTYVSDNWDYVQGV